jgi:TonB-dependent receptor
VINSDTRAVNRGETIQPVIDQIVYTAGESNNTLNVISNLLSVKQELPIFHMDLRLSHSYSESKSPQDLSFQFTQTPSGYANKGTIVKSPPSYIYSFLKPNASLATLAGMSTSETFSRERALTGSLDLQTDLPVIEGITSKIKFGASWQHRSRTYEYNQNNGTAWHDDGLINNLLKVYPGYLMGPTGDISMLNFVYDGYSYGKILNGDYNLPYPINVDEMWKILPIVKATTQIGSRGGYQYNLIASRINDYDGTEDKSAGYAMMTVNIGDQISVLPGIRYQNLTTKYSSLRGMLVPNGIQGHDTTVTDTHGEWLPMVHVRYRATDWLQIHLAYTNTLNYADYSAITPRYLIGTGYITYNNHQLKPARSENFDLVVAFHSNEVGLFTVNGFKKQIKDLIFFSKTYVTNVSKYPELPSLSNALYEFNTYVNNPNRINIYGVETEWQTHFWYLPQPFTGIVLNFNYTHIFSEAKYPKSSVDYQYNDDGTFTATFTDTSYTTRMLDQPNDIVNLTLGYDYEGFSARVSMLYQDNIFKKPDFWSQLRTTSAKYTRWDLSVKQQLPWFGMQVFFNMNNITGENEIDLNPKTNFLASEQRYGMSADLGIMIRL